MDSLRVGNGIKNIEVNDHGEYISIPISDASFYERFAAVIGNFEKKKEEISQKAKELSEKHKGKEEYDAEMIMDGVHLYSDLCKYTCKELDNLFGDGCCRKVFTGVEIPGVELIGEFFDSISPIITQYAKERNQKICTMYNRNRKGARSK